MSTMVLVFILVNHLTCICKLIDDIFNLASLFCFQLPLFFFCPGLSSCQGCYLFAFLLRFCNIRRLFRKQFPIKSALFWSRNTICLCVKINAKSFLTALHSGFNDTGKMVNTTKSRRR